MWIFGLSIVSVIVIYAVHWIIILTDPKFRNRSSLPPGSMGFPFIGETIQFMIPSYSFDIHPFITRRIQRFGPIFRTSLFGQPVVISTDPEFNNYLMQQEGKLVELWAGPLTNKISDGFEGSFGIPFHKYFRSVTLNHIGTECLRGKLFPQFEDMIIKTLHQWSTQTSVDVKQSITKMNFRFFAKHYFGYDTENLPSNNDERISEELFTDFTDGLKTIPLNISGTSYQKCLEEWKKAFRIVKKFLEERRNSPGKYRGDFLDRVIGNMEKDKILTEELVVYLVLGIWFASSASISSMIQLIFKFLSEYPLVVEELRADHEEILRSRNNSRSSSSLTWDEYKSMKFTQHVMNETLRFSILLPGLLRITLKDIHVNGYIIPANWIILAFAQNLHVNSEIYKDPLTFNPWRWKDLDSFIVSKNFKPFGGGLRQCPGAELSRAYIATFIHVLITRFRWKKIKGGKVVRNPILEFSEGIHIKIWENRE